MAHSEIRLWSDGTFSLPMPCSGCGPTREEPHALHCIRATGRSWTERPEQLVEGQSARGLRTAISRAATSRGLTVETVKGDGFVAVGSPKSHAPARGSRHHHQKDSDDEASHPSTRSRTRPRSPRCGIWPRGRVRVSQAAASRNQLSPLARWPRARRTDGLWRYLAWSTSWSCVTNSAGWDVYPP